MIQPHALLANIGWREIGVLASIGMLLFGIYQYEASQLESPRDREEYLGKLENKSLKQGHFRITVANVEFEADDSFLYRLKRRLLRNIDGSIYVTVRVSEIAIPKHLWESDPAKVFFETNEFDVEQINNQIDSNGTLLVFRIDSPKYSDFKLFLDYLLKFFIALEETGTISVHQQRPY